MAINFGVAGNYNVFVFQDMNMSNTDAEGRVAVGGNATLVNYGIGSGISPLPPPGTDNSFVIGGNVNVTNGSNASGNTVRNPSGTVINYTMGNPNGAFITGTPIDFTAAQAYLECASVFWGGLSPNGTGNVSFGTLTLTGVDPNLNIFNINANNVAGSGLALNMLNGINIVAPVSSTILINVTGINIAFGSYQIFRNGVAATRTDARTIVWNFPQALTWTNSTTAIYGSVLAPFAAASTTFSQINGNIIFDSFSGNAESHNELFIGNLPDATPCLQTTTSTTTTSTTSTSTTTTSTTSTSTTTTSTTSTSTTTTTTTTTSTTSTTSTTTIDPSCRKFCETDKFCTACQNANFKNIEVFVTVSITNFKIICTSQGNKVIVNGLKHIELVYSSNKCCKDVHHEHFQVPFCQFILRTNTCDTIAFIKASVLHISVEEINCNSIIVSTTILLCPIFKNPCDKHGLDNDLHLNTHEISFYHKGKIVYTKWTCKE
ncbi:choice-of-anchor A family protein [Clostridium sp.]|uniref:choice-of-anchor A family protein n=1 Tax=Clostridium sp. TaxID=1506 RepID=UPI0026226E95|nr:choice-of-anchor A family protein [uncultured Clostridium sp.]